MLYNIFIYGEIKKDINKVLAKVLKFWPKFFGYRFYARGSVHEDPIKTAFSKAITNFLNNNRKT